MDETKWTFTEYGLWPTGSDNWNIVTGEAQGIPPDATLGGSLQEQIEERDGGLCVQ